MAVRLASVDDALLMGATEMEMGMEVRAPGTETEIVIAMRNFLMTLTT